MRSSIIWILFFLLVIMLMNEQSENRTQRYALVQASTPSCVNDNRPLLKEMPKHNYDYRVGKRPFLGSDT
jgi:hypothetical protein